MTNQHLVWCQSATAHTRTHLNMFLGLSLTSCVSSKCLHQKIHSCCVTLEARECEAKECVRLSAYHTCSLVFLVNGGFEVREHFVCKDQPLCVLMDIFDFLFIFKNNFAKSINFAKSVYFYWNFKYFTFICFHKPILN